MWGPVAGPSVVTGLRELMALHVPSSCYPLLPWSLGITMTSPGQGLDVRYVHTLLCVRDMAGAELAPQVAVSAVHVEADGCPHSARSHAPNAGA